MLELYDDLDSFGFLPIVSLHFIHDFIREYIIAVATNKTDCWSVSTGLRRILSSIVDYRFLLDTEKIVQVDADNMFFSIPFYYKNSYRQIYGNLSIYDLISFDHMKIQSAGLEIKDCKICNRIYIQTDKRQNKCPFCREQRYAKRTTDDFKKALDKFNRRTDEIKRRFIGNNRDENEWSENDRYYFENIYLPIKSRGKAELQHFKNNNDLDGYTEYLDKLSDEHRAKRDIHKANTERE